MKKGSDVSAKFGGLYVVHHNLPGQRHRRIKREEHLVFIPLQGEIRIDLDGRKLRAGPGRLVYLPRGQVHEFESSEDRGERLVALVDDRLIRPVAKTLELRLTEAAIVPLPQISKELLFFLLLNPRTRFAPSVAKIFVETFLEALAFGNLSDPSDGLARFELHAQDPRIEAAIAYMRENLSEELSMEDVARKAGLSVRNFGRRMIEETNLSPRQMLIRFRVEKACELLSAPNAGVLDVALGVGYRSLSQFIAAFRSVTGQLPSEFARYGRKPKF